MRTLKIYLIGIPMLMLIALPLVTFIPKCAKTTSNNRAMTFMLSADDKASCTSWGTSAGSSSVATDAAWCESDHVWFYCTGGAARWEKDKDGSWFNLNSPRCDAKLNKAAPPAPAPQPQAQPQVAPAPAPTPAPAPPAAPPVPTPAPAPSSPSATGSAGSAS